jgi:hypothetical protein
METSTTIGIPPVVTAIGSVDRPETDLATDRSHQPDDQPSAAHDAQGASLDASRSSAPTDLVDFTIDDDDETGLTAPLMGFDDERHADDDHGGRP